MRDLEVGRMVRSLRRRRGWRQQDAAVRSRVHRSTWSLIERGKVERISLHTLRRCLAALEVRLELLPRGRGPELDRMRDEAHAALQAEWVGRLRRRGWAVWVERTYSVYGERGRVDLLAWHAAALTLLVVEIKTDLVDAQELLGGIDQKRRLAARLAQELGLPKPVAVVPMIVFAESMTVRRRLARVAPLFRGFPVRGRAALAWLRRPSAAPGLLLFTRAHQWRVRGQTRVRHASPRPGSSSGSAPGSSGRAASIH